MKCSKLVQINLFNVHLMPMIATQVVPSLPFECGGRGSSPRFKDGKNKAGRRGPHFPRPRWQVQRPPSRTTCPGRWVKLLLPYFLLVILPCLRGNEKADSQLGKAIDRFPPRRCRSGAAADEDGQRPGVDAPGPTASRQRWQLPHTKSPRCETPACCTRGDPDGGEALLSRQHLGSMRRWERLCSGLLRNPAIIH